MRWTTPPYLRFIARVDRSDPDGCWPWLGKQAGGYGRFWLDGEWVGAHRYAAGDFNLPPPGLVAAHHCDNPICVNRDHLFLTDHAGNMADLAAKGRRKGRGGLPGETHHQARLTWDSVREIRARYATQTQTIYDLAATFGVSPQQVSKIVRNERWVEVA